MKTNRLQLSSEIVRICPFILLMVVFVQCTGLEGPMGPQGYDGQNGLDGINYTHSVIYDVDPSEWSGNTDGYNVSLNMPEITDDIYYNGAVLVYKLIEIEPKSFNLLPYTYVDNALTIYFDFDAYVGSINLIYKEVLDGVNDTPAPADIMSFKVVIIEGIPLATLKTMVNVNDFAAVSKMLNIDNGHSNNQ
ncbi:MAG TPA: hypothetical protein VFC41_09635 [Anaerovoracaceae bacterium]|nr:hypothetical protein [Anaerovoracaceae bacterium]